MKKRQVWVTCILLFAAVTIAGFQNFSLVPLANLKPRLTTAAARANALAGDSECDMREIAPHRPLEYDSVSGPEKPSIAVPTAGNDLSSISQNWAQQQAHLLTNGNDQKFLEDVNRNINRSVNRLLKNSGAEDDAAPPDGVRANQVKDRAAAEVDSGLVAPSLRFTAVNRFELGFAHSTNLSCSVDGDNVHWDLSRALGAGVNLNFRHEPVNNSNTIRLHYSW